MEEPRVTYYRCRKCGATDKDRGNNLPAPKSLVCYRTGCRNEMFPDSTAERDHESGEAATA